MIELHPVRVRDVNDSSRHYDGLYEEEFSGWETGQILSRYLWILHLLEVQPDERLLDVSCGNGYLAAAAMKRHLKSFGLDFSMTGLRKARELAAESVYLCSDAEVLPLADNVFDCIANIGSLEHYLHPERSVKEMARVLRPGGRALILVPNAYGLFGNIMYVWRYGDIFVDDQPLQRYATRGWWTRLLEDNGLTVVRTVGYERELPRTWTDWQAYLRHPSRLARALLAPLVPVNLADSLVFLCRSDV